MAKKRGKQPIVHKRTVKDTLTLTGLLEIGEMQGFLMDLEEMGIIDVSNKLKQYDGQHVSIHISQKTETDLEQDEE